MATKGLWLWKITPQLLIVNIFKQNRKMAKLGVVGGAVYFTVATGVWGRDTKQVQSLMEQALGQVEGTGKQKEIFQEKQELSWENSWNNGTQKVFKWLADVPEKAKERTIEKTQEGVSKITKLFKS